jgi:type VI secretion system protein ImpK
MQERTQSSYPLLRQFREFYCEVTRLRLLALGTFDLDPAPASISAVNRRLPGPGSAAGSRSETLSTATAVAEAPEISPEMALTVRVWEQMARYLDERMFEMRHAPSALSRDLQEELVYVMAAFADETFICLLDWSGAAYWRNNLMEVRLFRSQISGQVIFRRIDSLLMREDYGTAELCAVYLMVLSLGFRGSYLRDPATAELYKKRLYERLVVMNPSLRRESQHVFPEAYRHTVSEGAPARLPDPKRWWLVVAAVVGAWLLGSTLLWWRVTLPTRGLLTQTANALNVLNERSNAGVVAKWLPIPFQRVENSFRVDLPNSLSMNQVVTKAGTSQSPGAVIVAVTGPQGGSAGSAENVRAWLAEGMIAFPTAQGDMAPRSQAVKSVARLNPAPAGITLGGTAQLFSVDTGLSTADLELHPQLILPADEPSGNGSIGAVLLYVPDTAAPGPSGSGSQ